MLHAVVQHLDAEGIPQSYLRVIIVGRWIEGLKVILTNSQLSTLNSQLLATVCLKFYEYE